MIKGWSINSNVCECEREKEREPKGCQSQRARSDRQPALLQATHPRTIAGLQVPNNRPVPSSIMKQVTFSGTQI